MWKDIEMHHLRIILVILFFQVLGVSVCRGEVILNLWTVGNQSNPRAVSLAGGRIGVAWYSMNMPDYQWPIMNNYNHQLEPRDWPDEWISLLSHLCSYGIEIAAIEGDSAFVAGFNRYTTYDSISMEAYVRKFNHRGLPLSDDIMVNTDTVGRQGINALLVDGANRQIIVCWATGDPGCEFVLSQRFRVFDFDLQPLSGEITIYEHQGVEGTNFVMGMLSPTRLIAVWMKPYSLSFTDIAARCIDIDGQNPSGEFIVNEHVELGKYYEPAVLGLRGGGALMLWSADFGSYEASIWGRRFDMFGNPIDQTDVLISVPDTNGDGNCEIQARIAAVEEPVNGYIAISWQQDNGRREATFYPVMRLFDPTLYPMTAPIRVGQTEGGGSMGTIALLTPDTVLVCWEGRAPGEYQTDIYGELISFWPSAIEDEPTMPAEMQLTAYPNPFNSAVNFAYMIGTDGCIKLKIYNILGDEIAVLIDRFQNRGEYNVTWNAGSFSSGTYFIRLESEDYIFNKRITLIK